MPRITVYIACHNYGAYVREAIESVLCQTVNDWELLLIDDGSTDDTHEVFESYINHPKIRIFRTEGISLPAVNNLALNEAKGKYIIRLDGDDIFDENILLVLGNYLDKDDELALVFPDYYLIEETGEIFFHEWRSKLHTKDHLMDEPPNGACTMVRSDVLLKIGGYREDLGAQDGLDLWLKIKGQYKSTNVNLPLFYYRRHGKNLTEQPLKILNARREIKSDMASKELGNKRPVIAVIPCRKNYDFVENLWAQKISGKSLLERDILVCTSSDIFDYIVVACDNSDAELIVKKFGHDHRVKFFLRDEKSTLRSTSIVVTLNKIVATYDPERNGIVLMRYIQTPFVTKGTIEEAVNSIIISDVDCAFAVEAIRHDVFERKANGLVPLNPSAYGIVNTSCLYRDSSTCIAVKTQKLKGGSLRGSNAAGFKVSAAESFFISSGNDVEVASNLEAVSKNGISLGSKHKQESISKS